MVPALASVFDSEVTSLRMCYHPIRLGTCRLPTGRTFLMFSISSAWMITSRTLPAKRAPIGRPYFICAASRFIRFPPTKPEAGGTAPKRTFTVRHRLLRISLASPPLPIRLGLSWLSFSPPGFCLPQAQTFAGSPRRSHLDSACRQTEAPHASRVAGTRRSKPQPRARDSHPLCVADLFTAHYGNELKHSESVSPTRPRVATRVVRIPRIQVPVAAHRLHPQYVAVHRAESSVTSAIAIG